MKNFKIETPSFKSDYYKKIWLVLEDGGSDSWLYVCRQSLTYFFIRIIDFPAYCGRDADFLFAADVSVVDLLNVNKKSMISALEHMGIERELSILSESDRLEIANALFQYGTKAEMWDNRLGKIKCIHDRPDEMHPAFRKLRSDARKYAEENLFDEESRLETLDSTIINAIGTTAAEAMRGDLLLCLERAIDNDDATPEQKIMIKMYSGATHFINGEVIPDSLKGA